jgi:Rrf2 family protein
MLQITRKADYAVRLMMVVAADGSATTAQVARREDIPYQFLRKVAHALVAAGLLTGEKGGKGGLALARSADDITVLDVLNAIDELAVNDCTVTPDSCARRALCGAYPFWLEAQREMERVLARTPIARIARAHLALKAGMEQLTQERAQLAHSSRAKRPSLTGRTASEKGTRVRLESEQYGNY